MHSYIGDAITGEESATASRAVDGLEDVLDDPHCRYVLEYLGGKDGPVHEETLARHAVAGITDTSPDDVGDDVCRRVQTWLHHGQLPVLDEHGVVAFDAETGEVWLRSDRA